MQLWRNSNKWRDYIHDTPITAGLHTDGVTSIVIDTSDI